jgi:hypothetical protein
MFYILSGSTIIMSKSAARRQTRQAASLADLLRAEGAKPYRGQQDCQDGAAAGHAAPNDGPPPSKQEALVAALYDLAIGGSIPAARLVLAYAEGRPAQVQVNIAQHKPSKTYVVVSPDDWPAP